jgi:hypothetical protein
MQQSDSEEAAMAALSHRIQTWQRQRKARTAQIVEDRVEFNDQRMEWIDQLKDMKAAADVVHRGSTQAILAMSDEQIEQVFSIERVKEIQGSSNRPRKMWTAFCLPRCIQRWPSCNS